MDLFQDYGEVISATVEMRGTRSMGYGIVTFRSEADAKRRAAKKWLRGVTGCLGLQC